jgi:beta-N-acetylhexosaminidase
VRAFPRFRFLALAVIPVAVALAAGACHGGGGGGGGGGTPVTAPDPAQRAAAAVAGLSDTDLVGQVLVPSVNLDTPPATAAALVSKYHLGGVILMGELRPGDAAEQLRALTAALQQAAHGLGDPVNRDTAMLVGTDQEYGFVTRIRSGMVQLPSAMTFGAAGRPELTEAAWRAAGAELAAVGINVDFAPDADVIGSEGNTVIGSRSFGSSPTAVAPQVAAAVRGLQSAGVAATLKHFPGHGHTTVNSHEALPVLGQSMTALTSGDLPPFQAGIGAGSWMVMSGHLDVNAVDPGLPASFSAKVLGDVLRGQLKFGGVVVTDALNMAPAQAWPPAEATVRAMLAGNDLLLMPPDLGASQRGLLDALASGRLPRARLVEAATRAATLRYRLAGFDRPSAAAMNTPAHLDAAAAVSSAAVTVLRGSCAGPLAAGPVRITASSGRQEQVGWLTDALRQAGVAVTGSGGTQVHLVGYGDGPADLAAGANVTVAMDTPYVLAGSGSPVLVATYSSTEASMRALAAVIAGKAKATGRSPVTVAGLPASACSA